MTSLAVITPSYSPDLELCRDLNASVMAHTEASVTHYIIVPRRDLGAFSGLRSERTLVWSVEELLPAHIMKIPAVNGWLSRRRLYLPINGHMMQQVVKIEIASRLQEDLLLLADSDVAFVRLVTAETFMNGGRVHFYRKDRAVDEGMPLHVTWHRVARSLLGIPPAEVPLPDYISAFNVWERKSVLLLQRHIQDIHGRPWLDIIAGQVGRYFSEFILYGVFIDHVLGGKAEVTPAQTSLCHSYWDRTPLSRDEAGLFVQGREPTDVAVMISAKSNTPLTARRTALLHSR